MLSRNRFENTDAHAIQAASTSTAGFVGPVRWGPLDGVPALLTSLADFERVYGDGQPLQFGEDDTQPNYLWHAARAFFENGGRRLYIARIFREAGAREAGAREAGADGIARAVLVTTAGAADPASTVTIQARCPGASGNCRVRFTLRIGENTISGTRGQVQLDGLQNNDIGRLDAASASAEPPGASMFALASQDEDEQTWVIRSGRDKTDTDWRLNAPEGSGLPVLDPAAGDSLHRVTVSVTVIGADGSEQVWSDLSLGPRHHTSDAPDGEGTIDSVFDVFSASPAAGDRTGSVPILISAGEGETTGLDLLNLLLIQNPRLTGLLNEPGASDADRSVEVALEGGSDGARPGAADYEGRVDESTQIKTGLRALEDLDELSIVASPGSTCDADEALTIIGHLIAHAERMRYRIALIDSVPDSAISNSGGASGLADVRELRAKIESSYAALYYPWLRAADPLTGQELLLPPSGFVAGIYARTDAQRGVNKAPANEAVRLATGLEKTLNARQADALNALGINCFRTFPGRGLRLWGARTASSDPEWKYIHLRRYFAYLEHSIDSGTQWVVFEPNGEDLWANVRRAVEDFLLNEWQSGALLGDKPEQAFFVRCDRSTMTQDDIDNGRLICLIGVAPTRPAEFVIIRIGQWTAGCQGPDCP